MDNAEGEDDANKKTSDARYRLTIDRESMAVQVTDVGSILKEGQGEDLLDSGKKKR